MIRFLTLNYYFNLRPISGNRTLVVLLVFFAVLILIGLAIKLYAKIKNLKKIDRKLIDKYFLFFIVMGLLGILITWFRYESAYLLSARFWLVIWVIGALIWLIKIIRFQFKTVPEAKKMAEQKQQFKKYLPQRSKKK